MKNDETCEPDNVRDKNCLLSEYAQFDNQKLSGLVCEDEAVKYISHNLIAILKTNRMSQKEFAKRVGATEASVSRYLNGERMPRVSVLMNIACVFGISLDSLVMPCTKEVERHGN